MTTADYQAAHAGKTEKESNLDDNDFQWAFDIDEKKREEKEIARERIIGPIRSAFLIHLIQAGFTEEQRHQRAMFYFLMIQLHEDLDRPLRAYSALPALAMWYFPRISPMPVYGLTRAIDEYRRQRYKNATELLTPMFSSLLSTILFTFVDLRDASTILEPLYGPISRWPAALLPIFPGLFLRLINEHPNSINGFIPENKQGILMAAFAQACAAVLPRFVQWPIWAAYSSPSPQYPSMFVEWLLCTFTWILTDTSPMAGYAIWLLVNQYRHANTWLWNSGGGPSVVLERERRGTMWYIATITLTRLLAHEAGQAISESEFLILRPQVWVPFALIFAIGIYLLRYGLALRIYKFQYKPLSAGKSIRLLRLRAQPCLPNAPIQCDMIHTHLRRPPQYVAVSHRWDPVSASQEMILINGGLFPVSSSIYAFLLARRDKFHSEYLWIDSICINQDDKDEKSSQVAMIRHIFEEAEMTIGWLGYDPGAKKAFELIRRVNKTTTADSCARLWSDPSAGWKELKAMILKDWFDRIWIVQEIAVAKGRVLRYGDEAIGWDELSRALTRLMHFESVLENNLGNPIDLPEILNALIIQDITCHVANITLIKLKDALKLTRRFKASLPIDKVYALLGLVDERHLPLLHPKFGASADRPISKDATNATMLAKDACEILELLTDLLGAGRGATSSRRARAIISLGADNALRYTFILHRDLTRLTDRLKQLNEGKVKLEDEDPIQPDYSAKTTATLTYTHVAKDLVKVGDALAFICHAGLGQPRSQELANLPSWVPDWSTDISVHILPWRKIDAPPTSGETEIELVESRKPEAVFQNNGPKGLSIKAVKLGCITHSAILTQDYVRPGGVNNIPAPELRETVERDYLLHSPRIQKAWKLAQQHLSVSAGYRREEKTLKESFYRTLTADSIVTRENLALNTIREWVAGPASTSSITASLWPENHQSYWTNLLASDFRDGQLDRIQRYRTDIFKQYISARQKSSSSNAKFANLVRADIVPSISLYRTENPSAETLGRRQATSSQPMMLNGDKADSNSILSNYEKSIDYTIGRSFVIIDSGLMGLACADSREGDVVVQLQDQDRTVWLTLREEEPQEAGTAELHSASAEVKPSKETKQEPNFHDGAFRLIGEAYVHGGALEASANAGLQWFKLW